jgi:hypothetical protein
MIEPFQFTEGGRMDREKCPKCGAQMEVMRYAAHKDGDKKIAESEGLVRVECVKLEESLPI